MNTSPEISAYMADLARKSHEKRKTKTKDERREATVKGTYFTIRNFKGDAAAYSWLEERYGSKKAKWLLHSWNMALPQPLDT